jgi:photosystem II stability/assembly factor-like uncharacterized protein
VRALWLAALLAGCGVATPAATKSPACAGVVSPSRLGTIHFVSPRIGVGRTTPSSRCGPMLAITRDGGSSWTVQPVPEPTAAPAVTRRTLWALGCPHLNNGRCRPVLARKRLLVVATGGSDSQLRLAVSIDGGRRWRSSSPRWSGRPCRGADVAAADPADWWVICIGSAAAGSSTKALLHTTDAGRTWSIASQVTSLTAPPQPGAISRAEPNALAAGSRTRLWLAGWNSMTESDDAGTNWTDVPGVNPEGAPAVFDVLSPNQAWLLAAGRGLWRTTDGRHWKEL